MKHHRFKRVNKGSTRKKNQKKYVRVGARHPGRPKSNGGHGSVRSPY